MNTRERITHKGKKSNSSLKGDRDISYYCGLRSTKVLPAGMQWLKKKCVVKAVIKASGTDLIEKKSEKYFMMTIGK
jgi:hypothetical protein